MKRTILTTCIVISLASLAFAQDDHAETFRVFGKITYFDGSPVVEGEVSIRDAWFRKAFQTTTDENGDYELTVTKGKYQALYACKDYAVKNLEFWAWDLVVDRDLEINARIGGLEVYAINAFKEQGGSGFFIYFRPMSLKRSLATGLSREEREKLPLLDEVPKLLIDNVKIKINDQEAKVQDVLMVKRMVDGGTDMFAYFVQPVLPEGWWKENPVRIWITLTDPQTGEKGEGCLFWERK